MKHIDEMAQFLGVTINYLLHGDVSNDESITLTKEERKLVYKFRKLNSHKKNTIMDLITMIE